MASNIGSSPVNPRTMPFSSYSNLIFVVQAFLMWFIMFLLLDSGFSQSQSDCTYLLSKASGQFSSPGFPGPYPARAQCTWTISMPAFERILVTFVTFKVESGSSNSVCDRDFVEILDGQSGTKSLGKFCNSQKRYPKGTIRSTESTVRVIFKSDAFNPPGFIGLFLANYQKQPCGGYLTAPKGEITSPNYPYPYPATKECIWKIQVPSNMVIRLYFLDFALEPRSECNLDYIKVRDGFNVTSRLTWHFCAKRKPVTELRSTGNIMWLEFKSFMPTMSLGFKAYYEADSHCGGLLVGSFGSFTSPELPKQPKDDVCTWKIQAGDKEIVSLVFSRFDIDSRTSNKACKEDYVEFYDGTDVKSRVLGRYCNMVRIPQDIRSTGKTMLVKLHRSIYARGTGFFATYSSVDPNNHFDKCSESANELLYRCNNGEYIQCQWKCDGTDDCQDKSDEKNCQKEIPTAAPSKLRNYVIILVSITGSAVAIVLVAFVVDRLRKKRRARARVRRRRRRRRLDGPRIGDTSEPSSPPPPYEFEASLSNCLDPSPSHPPPYSSHTTPTENNDSATSSTSVTLQEIAAGSLPSTEQQTRDDEHDVQCEHAASAISDDTDFPLSVSQEPEVVSLSSSPPSSDTAPLIA